MSNFNGLRVLLVEDDPLVAMLAEDLLDAIGCVVAATAGSVADAQAAIASTPFDIAMVDINLDGEDGLLVADALAAQGAPFLITTGYDASGVRARHADAFVLTKPYALSDLANALRRCTAQA